MSQLASTPNPLLPFLERQGAVVLDGGLATELEARGADLSDALWSARLLRDDPNLIRRAHLAYLRAGADCIASASYQATVEGFRRAGLGVAEAERLLRLSVALAREAREELWRYPTARRGRLKPLVAASLGPYGAFLADGSEYRGDDGLDEAALRVFHRPRLALLVSAGADLLAFETIPSAREGRALASLLREHPGTWAWMSFSCRDGRHLSDGTPLASIFAELDKEPSLVALGVNCVPPELVGPLIAEARRATEKPIAVYPNSGEPWDAEKRSWCERKEKAELATLATAWHNAGARLIGGCCRTQPRDIEHLRQTLVGQGLPGLQKTVSDRFS